MDTRDFPRETHSTRTNRQSRRSTKNKYHAIDIYTVEEAEGHYFTFPCETKKGIITSRSSKLS